MIEEGYSQLTSNNNDPNGVLRTIMFGNGHVQVPRKGSKIETRKFIKE
jgi:hypothetical protein